MSASSTETLLLKQPSVSSAEISFLYAGDIWIASHAGSDPRRLTAQKGQKIAPSFSPDGNWVAFSANYDGNLSVYAVPREGGAPRRLTHHPVDDLVRGWTPDGKRILFASARESVSGRYRKLFTVPLEGSFPAPLPMPIAERGSYSPVENRLAYTPYYEIFWSWKHYRGGMALPIWLLDLKTLDQVEIPHEKGSDTFPCWMGDSIYFLSDRQQTMNVFRYIVNSGGIEQVTFHSDYDVRSLTAGGGLLVYEQGGRIHLYNPVTRVVTPLLISINADLPFARPNYQKVTHQIQTSGISSTGQRALFEARGEIFTVPAKKGEIRNITHTPGVAERFPAWSPDGRSIAYFSDAGGEYNLVISDQKGIEKTVISMEKIPGGRTFFYSPLWSPDSKKIAFTDKTLHLYYIDLDSQVISTVDADLYDQPARSLNPAWSPDSQWLAYSRRLDNQLRSIFLYNLAEKAVAQATDGMSDAIDPCFSRDGQYLFFAASTDFGLNTGWLDMSAYERPVTRNLYVILLNKEGRLPLISESDEEKPAADRKDDEKTPGPVKVKVDLEGIDRRIQALPVPARDYFRLQPAENKLFFLERLPGQPLQAEPKSLTLYAYHLKERKAEVFTERVAEHYSISADGKKLLYCIVGSEPGYWIGEIDGKPDAADGMINLDLLEVLVDPRAEWRQIFLEAYRLHRDFFYDAHLHGLDLEKAYKKYLPFLDHVGHRDDLNYLLSEFSAELIAGHVFVGGGDVPFVDPLPVGLLGADIELTPEGFYRIRHLIPRINWHPELRSPLTEPGVNVKEGDYILAVNGRLLMAPLDFYQAFEKTAEHDTEILVGPTTQESDARAVTVKPIRSEMNLRHWAWVESNRKKVDELSKGQVAYVYLPDTGFDGYASFNRYYFSQLNKSGVVLDARFNGGGNIADYVIDLLNRPLLSYWATREGRVFMTPNASIRGPRVMIINELTASGGDALPYFFRQRGLGKLVGKRTLGALMGIYDYPMLVDGGFVTSPRMAIFSEQGEWIVENNGVSPDIEVEMITKQVMADHDPQLEKAVEVVLAELAADPPGKVRRPFPADKVKGS